MSCLAEVAAAPAADEALQADWRRLAEARGNAFVTPEWCLTWLRHYADTARPFVVCARGAGGHLRGVVPLVIARRARLRVIQFAGAGLGDYFHPAARAADEEAVAASAGELLARSRDDWHAVVLRNVEPESAWVRRLAETAGRVSVASGPAETLPHVALAGETWETIMAHRSRNLREQLGRKLRQLERHHDVRFRQTQSEDEIARDLAVLFELHDLRRSTRGGSSLADGRARRFHGDFAAAILRAGWLRLSFLEVDGEPVAALYGWRLGSRYSYYLTGFDPAWSKASVGLLLLAHTMRAAVDEGAQEYDLLLGDEPYKLRFTDAARTMRTTVLTRPLSPVRIAVGGELALRRAGRHLPDPIRARVRGAASSVLRRLPAALDR